MLTCPSCDTPLQQDFGMVTCGHCQAVLMININGQVIMGGSENFDTPEADDSLQSQEYFDAEEPSQFESSFRREPVEPFGEQEAWGDNESEEESFSAANFEDNLGRNLEDNVEDHLGDGLGDQGFVPEVEEELAPAMGADSDLSDSFEPESAMPYAEDPDEQPESLGIAAAPDTTPVDVTSFANSEESNLEDGELVYDLLVAGLDSKDLRETIRLILMDKRLKLDVPAIMRGIEGGKARIESLNPVKAKRIVEQLQFYSLDVRWRQRRVIMDQGVAEPSVGEGEVSA